MPLAAIEPAIPAEQADGDEEQLQRHVAVQARLPEQDEEADGIGDAGGPVPWILANGEPDGERAGDEPGDLEKIHGVLDYKPAPVRRAACVVREPADTIGGSCLAQFATSTGRSFNGRTRRSGRRYRGSNPCLPATLFSAESLMVSPGSLEDTRSSVISSVIASRSGLIPPRPR